MSFLTKEKAEKKKNLNADIGFIKKVDPFQKERKRSELNL